MADELSAKVPMTMREREQYRRNAAGQLVTGGAMLAAGQGAKAGLDVRLKRRMPGVEHPGVLAAAGRSIKGKRPGFSAGTHLPHLGGSLVARGVQVASLPLLAAGARGVVRPKHNKRVSLKEDVIAPSVRGAVLADQAEKIKPVSKIAPRIVYHGTTRRAARKIARDGIKESPGAKGVFVSGDQGIADSWARRNNYPGDKPRALRRLRFMAVGPARTDDPRYNSLLRASQLIPDGKRTGHVVKMSPKRREAEDYLRSLPPGQRRMVSAERLDPALAGSGFRLYDRRYVARMALAMDSDPALRAAPTRFVVHADGKVRQEDGAHRYAARNMRGAKRVPVVVTRSESKAPSKAAKLYRPSRRHIQAKRRAKDRGMDRARMERMASSVPSWSDPVNRTMSSLAKALDEREQRRLQAHRSFGRTSSLTSGTLGLAALGLRSPQAAASLVRRGARNGRLVRMASRADAATKHSNTLGIAAIGVGSAGSFNYAAQQKLERKAAQPVSKLVVRTPVKVVRRFMADPVKRPTAAVAALKEEMDRPGAYFKPPQVMMRSRHNLSPAGIAMAREQGVPRRKLGTIIPTPKVLDGHHRLAVAEQQGRRSIPIDYRLMFGNSMPDEKTITRGGSLVHRRPTRIPKDRTREAAVGAVVAGVGAPAGVAYVANDYRKGRALEKSLGTRLVAPVSRHLDRRALRLAHQLAPTGSPLANGARIGTHRVERSGWGTRKVTTSLERGGKAIGDVKTVALPTRHVFVDSAHVDYPERGKGVGTSALGVLTRNAPKAKTPGVYWIASGDAKGPGGMHGARAWKHGEARYVRGVPFVPGDAAVALKDLHPTARAAGKRAVRRARAGALKPKDMVAEAGPTAGAALEGLPWMARVKGGQPFARKTRYAAGGAALGAAGAHEVRKSSFLRRYENRISPHAERGWKTLRHGEREHTASGTAQEAVGGLSAWGAVHELAQRPRNKPAIAAYIAATGASAIGSSQAFRSAGVYRGKRRKIEAKGRSRAAQGLYAPGRGLSPVDTSSKRFGKASVTPASRAANLASTAPGGLR